MSKKFLLGLGLLACSVMAYADEVINIYSVSEEKQIGTVTLTPLYNGVLITPSINGLTFGSHGFHVHVNPDCGDNGMAAGGHLDPKQTDAHLGPYNDEGHLGDLPVLVVDEGGHASLPVFAPRLKLSDFYGRSIMIHEGGDNYSDEPAKLGGGGRRIACGVVKKLESEPSSL